MRIGMRVGPFWISGSTRRRTRRPAAAYRPPYGSPAGHRSGATELIVAGMFTLPCLFGVVVGVLAEGAAPGRGESIGWWTAGLVFAAMLVLLFWHELRRN